MVVPHTLMVPALLAVGNLSGWLIVLCAAASGVLSMWLYKVTSPQARLADVVSRLKQTQQQVIALDGEFDEAWPLIVESLQLSMKRLGMVIGPTLAAGLPVIAAMIWMDATYPEVEVLPFGPHWMRSAEAAFLVVVSLSALSVKRLLRIT